MNGNVGVLVLVFGLPLAVAFVLIVRQLPDQREIDDAEAPPSSGHERYNRTGGLVEPRSQQAPPSWPVAEREAPPQQTPRPAPRAEAPRNPAPLPQQQAPRRSSPLPPKGQSAQQPQRGLLWRMVDAYLEVGGHKKDDRPVWLRNVRADPNCRVCKGKGYIGGVPGLRGAGAAIPAQECTCWAGQRQRAYQMKMEQEARLQHALSMSNDPAAGGMTQDQTYSYEAQMLADRLGIGGDLGELMGNSVLTLCCLQKTCTCGENHRWSNGRVWVFDGPGPRANPVECLFPRYASVAQRIMFDPQENMTDEERAADDARVEARRAKRALGPSEHEIRTKSGALTMCCSKEVCECGLNSRWHENATWVFDGPGRDATPLKPAFTTTTFFRRDEVNADDPVDTAASGDQVEETHDSVLNEPSSDPIEVNGVSDRSAAVRMDAATEDSTPNGPTDPWPTTRMAALTIDATRHVSAAAGASMPPSFIDLRLSLLEFYIKISHIKTNQL